MLRFLDGAEAFDRVVILQLFRLGHNLFHWLAFFIIIPQLLLMMALIIVLHHVDLDVIFIDVVVDRLLPVIGH